MRLPGLLILLSAGAWCQTRVEIREWEVPTPASHPHDPAVGADGSLWYTGQRSNKLGRLDPATGLIEEFPLEVDGSGPHGLVADKLGDIWFTGNARAYVGRLDVATRLVRPYYMPDDRARDPHTPIIDKDGILWFTVQSGNFVGRIDPASGEVVLKRPPTEGSRPYGIVIHPDGTPYFCEFATNKIARIDPRTLEIAEFVLPNQGARPRRLTITADGMVYYTDYLRGYLGRRRRPSHTESRPPRTAPFGTASPACNRTRWCGSIQPRSRSRSGRFPPGAGWCGTWWPPRTAGSTWPAAA